MRGEIRGNLGWWDLSGVWYTDAVGRGAGRVAQTTRTRE
jgi:hypothetical protein